jgi:hypothetical protein
MKNDKLTDIFSLSLGFLVYRLFFSFLKKNSNWTNQFLVKPTGF